MAVLSSTKANQLIGTGILLVLCGSGLFALLYIIHGSQYDFGDNEIFDRNAAFWVSIPVIVAGLLGVLAGINKTNTWVSLYMFGSVAATVLGMLVSITIGLKVTNTRFSCGEDSACKNSDTATLMGTIVLIGTITVTAGIWGGVKGCQSKWGPSKAGPKFATNGPTPIAMVVTNRNPMPTPSGSDGPGRANLVPVVIEDLKESTAEGTSNEPVDNPHKYQELQSRTTGKHDGDHQYESLQPAKKIPGDLAGADTARDASRSEVNVAYEDMELTTAL